MSGFKPSRTRRVIGAVVASVTLGSALVALSPTPPAQAAVFNEVVKPSTLKGACAPGTCSTTYPTGWLFYNDETDAGDPSLGSFVAGPAAPPSGTGSAQISVSGTQRRNLTTYQFAGIPLASITSMQYTTYNPSAGNGGGANRSAYINFNVDFNGSDTFQRRLTFVPANNGGVVPDSWKSWDAINSGNAMWTYSGPTWPMTATSGFTPRTWSDIVSSYPGVRIRVTDAFFGLRVGEPYANGYTENIDSFELGWTSPGPTANLVSTDFEPETPCTTTCYVDAATGNDVAGGDTPATAKKTIQAAVNAVNPGGTVVVADGTYVEDVNVNKSITLESAGPGLPVVSGPPGGDGATIRVGAAGVVIDGFAITREGNNPGQWNDPTLNTAGIAVQGQAADAEIRNSDLYGNRTAIDINNSNENNVHDNLIHDNRTGLIFRNQTDNTLFKKNRVTDNTTVGVLFLDASGAGVPPQSALNSQFNRNEIAGNWYGEVVDRQAGGALPPPGTTNTKDFTCNWYGTTSPVVTVANSTEPGYAAQIPPWAGGTAMDPGGQPDIAGPASANIIYSPYLFSSDLDGPCAASPNQGKSDVRNALQAMLPTGDKQTDKKLKDAVADLDKSLNPANWVDSSHLQPKKGEKVFEDEKHAVQALMGIKNPSPAVLQAIDDICAVDRQLAQIAIDDMTAGGGDPKELQKANQELAKGDADAANGKCDNAIDHYRNAWKHAQKA